MEQKYLETHYSIVIESNCDIFLEEPEWLLTNEKQILFLQSVLSDLKKCDSNLEDSEDYSDILMCVRKLIDYDKNSNDISIFFLSNELFSNLLLKFLTKYHNQITWIIKYHCFS